MWSTGEFKRDLFLLMKPGSIWERGQKDLLRIVSKYTSLKKVGRNYIGLCPFHNETEPSFTVNPKKQTFHCFGCKKHGNAEDFLREIAEIEGLVRNG